MVLGILAALVHHAVLVALLALHVVDVGMVVLQQEILEPLAVSTSVIGVGDEFRDGLHLLFELLLDGSVDERHPGLVALPFRTPMVGIDGQFACRLEVDTYVSHSEIHMGCGRHVVLGCRLPDKCGNFHIRLYVLCCNSYLMLSIILFLSSSSIL
jgi:hypothetical protein